MRRMGGHPDQKGCFEIRRAAVTPPDELLTLIWPELDNWKGKFGMQAGQIDDLAAGGLCTLLHHLREVILQDSVPLMEAFPNHPIWSHHAFHHKAYRAFAEEVKGYLSKDNATTILSISTRVLEALPDLVNSL